ncbi:MAG: M43 family zinc metalloprotease [Flavobacteriales bacterium]
MRTLSTALAAILVAPLLAQAPFHCGNDEFHRVGAPVVREHDFPQRVSNATEALEDFTRSFDEMATRGGSGGYVIPVVFHIIHNNGPENITDAQVHDAMRVLNEDFNRQNADWDNVRPEFLDIVADVGIEFRLATRDPQGNCTNGITRTVSPLTNEGAEQMKALISWPRNKYMQVWVAASADGAAGYTFRPGSAQFFPEEDGIVVQHLYLGSVGTSSPSRSRTLTHEVGHWLNLAHTWGNSNNPGLPENCLEDDGVSDTPNTEGWTTCSLNGASCGSELDNVENYMEYSYCSKMFTEGQKVRMIAALNNSTAQRNQLWLENNLTATGVNGNATLCAASFISNTREICAGGTVVFTDQSYHNITSRTWNFPGGEPSSTTDPVVVVTYPTGGTYSATLTVSDGQGSLSTTQQDIVVVLSNPGTAPPVTEGFESANQPDDIGWTVINNEAPGQGASAPVVINYGQASAYPNGAYGEAVPASNVASISPDAVGSKFLYLSSDTSTFPQNGQSISQSVTLTAGRTYLFGFDYYLPQNGFNNPNNATFTAALDGTPFATFTLGSVAPVTWFNVSDNDNQLSGNGTFELSFFSNGYTAKDIGIDRVYLIDSTAVPEPATWGLMLLGFGLVGAAARRRTRGAALA